MLEGLEQCPDAQTASDVMNTMCDSLKRFWQGFQFNADQIFLNVAQKEEPAAKKQRQA